MSGLYFIGSSTLGCINGHTIHHFGVTINGTVPAAAVMYIDTPADSLVFELMIAGRIKAKERVCGVQRTPADRAVRSAMYRAVSSKVKP